MEINNVEIMLSLFTIDKGVVKTLLIRKKDEPYKGYWTVPSYNAKKDELILKTVASICADKCGLTDVLFEQYYTFSDLNKIDGNHVINIGHIGLIDSKTVEIKECDLESIEKCWFDIKAIPKMAYNHEEILDKAIDFLREKLTNSNILKSFFPSDFTLPELQKVYELILGRELDRRNFRKKFLTFDLIEDTGYKNEGFNGRPAKLYRFKENILERDLF